MQVLINEDFVNRRSKIGQWGTLGGIAALLAGIVTSFDLQLVVVTYILLIVGLFAFNLGRYNAIRWGSRPREEEVLARALKGLDQKHVLINYAPGIPSSHILLSPFGLIHIETRHNYGQIVCEGDKWRNKSFIFGWLRGFAEGQLGNPSKSAQMAAGSLHQLLVQHLGPEMAAQVPVGGVVAFMSPRAQLSVSNPTVPVGMVSDLKAILRQSTADRAKMPPEVYRKVQALLLSGDGVVEQKEKNKSKR